MRSTGSVALRQHLKSLKLPREVPNLQSKFDFKVPLVPPVSTASATSGALVSFGDLFLDNACFYAFVTTPISTVSACNRVPHWGAPKERVGHSEQTLFIECPAGAPGNQRFQALPQRHGAWNATHSE